MTGLGFSEYVRGYYEAHNISFTDFEKAGVIYNHSENLADALDALKELAETTQDTSLKAQIKDRIGYTERCLDELRDNSSGDYIYEIWEYEDCSGDNYFLKFENALNFGMKYSECERIKIERFKLNCPYGECPEAGKCFYDKSGKLISVTLSVPEQGKPKDTYGAEVRFEDMFIPFEFPFSRGDIVRDTRRGTTGVLTTSKEEWDSHNERAVKSGVKSCRSDYNVNIENIYKDGGVRYSECDILLLEKVSEQGGISKAEWDMLCCMSGLMKGSRTFYDLQYCIKKYMSQFE